MRNVKPSQAAMRRAELDFDRPPEPVTSQCLVARMEDISGFEFEPLGGRATQNSSGGHAALRLALIATASLLFVTLIASAIVIPELLAR